MPIKKADISSKSVFDFKLRRHKGFVCIPLTSRLVAIHGEETIYFNGPDAYGSQDSSMEAKTFEIFDFKSGTKIDNPLASDKSEIYKIYPLSEEYFAVIEDDHDSLFVIATCDFKVKLSFGFYEILATNSPYSRENVLNALDSFFETIFFEKFAAHNEKTYNAIFYEYFKDLAKDDNRLIPSHCQLLEGGEHLLVKRPGRFMVHELQALNLTNLAASETIFAWPQHELIASYDQESQVLTFWEWKDNKFNFKNLKKINGIAEVADRLLADGRLVYRSNTAIEILNVADYSIEQLCAAVDVEHAHLNVMFDDSITFLKSSMPNQLFYRDYQISVYRFKKPLRCSHTAIYQAAKEAEDNLFGAEEKLKIVLSGRHVNIDIFDHDLMTPAGKLAKEGCQKAVDLLKKYGANINYIAQGAAMSGCNYLHTHSDININYVATGAAFAAKESLDYVEMLRTKYDANVNFLAAGAVLSGNTDYAELLRNNHKANVNFIAMTAARVGNVTYAEFLRKEHDAEIFYVALGAAMHADNTYAEYLRTEEGAPIHSLAHGAATAKRYQYAEFLHLEHGASIEVIAYAAAYAGDKYYVNELLLSYPRVLFYKLFESIAHGGHYNYLRYILDQPTRKFFRLHSYNVEIHRLQSFRNGTAKGGHTHLNELLYSDAPLNAKTKFVLHQNYVEGGHHQLIIDDAIHAVKFAEAAASGGQFHYVESFPDLVTKEVLDPALKKILGLALKSGHWFYVKNSKHKHYISEFYASITRGAVGVIDDSENLDKLYRNSYLVTHIDEITNHPRLALHTLSFYTIANARFNQFLFCTQPNFIWDYLERAKKIKLLKPKYNYNQCLALGNVALIFLFLKFATAEAEPTLIPLIATFLAPLSLKESIDLQGKIQSNYAPFFRAPRAKLAIKSANTNVPVNPRLASS